MEYSEVRLLFVALSLLAWSCAWAVERDDAAPLCGDPEFAAEVHFAAEQIEGFVVKVRSQKGPYLRAEELVYYPCWWELRPETSVPVCPVVFSPVATSSRPGDGDETVWLLWLATYRGEEVAPWTPCLDYENPDGSGNPDAIFAWHKPVTVLP